jgi:alpha-tubulin suppressor-like RCC1 family protein
MSAAMISGRRALSLGIVVVKMLALGSFIGPALAQRAETEAKISSSPRPSTLGERVTLTATVISTDGTTPRGEVQFRDGRRLIGTRVVIAHPGRQRNISAGQDLTCSVTNDGGVWCWGVNWYGQLGDGTIMERRAPVQVVGLAPRIVKSAGGRGHTCALSAAGSVYCWGRNEEGQLGDGTTRDRFRPAQVNSLDERAVSISSGQWHTCALTYTGRVKCWGRNKEGQLGDGTRERRRMPVEVRSLSAGVVGIATGIGMTCALTTIGKVKCWGGGFLGNGMYESLVPVDVMGLGYGVIAVAAGTNAGHTCAVTREGGVKCWGANYYGQLGDNSEIDRLFPVDVVGLSRGVLSVAPSDSFTCALTKVGGVKCWGDNYYGKLGDGTYRRRLTPVDVIGLDKGVSAIAAGRFHNCAISTDQQAVCWGLNDFGQIGDGTLRRWANSPASVISRAVATMETDQLPVGLRSLKARYVGSPEHRPSRSAPLLHRVRP